MKNRRRVVTASHDRAIVSADLAASVPMWLPMALPTSALAARATSVRKATPTLLSGTALNACEGM
ncbi:hypothetical protein [Paraburkholderia aromaticivorans]|uniref:Uncharacterized protein n=1 Tax=Paraburkholderia aromaticivorans TaxID=2026199 RepID=A0A248VJK2_9BURK|nr:hypothetical protein [Paraburkholderia aromaticivorans]ASV99205.1 hypothetical protein CJU94_14215 [Paraburkholderia aromaticivorans]